MAKRMSWSRRIAALVGCVMLVSAQAALAVRVSVALPTGSPTQFVIQPGESANFAIDFTNLDNAPGQGTGRARHLLIGLNTAFNMRWLIEPLDPHTCGYPIEGEGLRLEFAVELLANETRRCTYMITRLADSYLDGYLEICTGIDPQPNCTDRELLVFGTLPDVGVTVSTVAPPTVNATETTFRIDVSNAAALATDDSILFTQCRFTGSAVPTTVIPFQVEVGFPGACPSAVLTPCAIEPPADRFHWQVTIPSVPIAGSQSCLVKVRPREPFTAPVEDRFSSWAFSPFYPGHPIPLLFPGAPGAGRGYDMNPSNNVANFTLAPLGQPPQPVPIGRSAIAILSLLLGMIARLQLRSRRTAS